MSTEIETKETIDVEIVEAKKQLDNIKLQYQQTEVALNLNLNNVAEADERAKVANAKADEAERLADDRLQHLARVEAQIKASEGLLETRNGEARVIGTQIEGLLTEKKTAEEALDKAREDTKLAEEQRDNTRSQAESERLKLEQELSQLAQSFNEETVKIQDARGELNRRLTEAEHNLEQAQIKVRATNEVVEHLQARINVLNHDIKQLEATAIEKEQAGFEANEKLIATRTELNRTETAYALEVDALNKVKAEVVEINKIKFQAAAKSEALDRREEFIKEKYKAAGIDY